jgi:uncharacterized membrane protein
MKILLKLFALALPVFLALDMIWLGFVAKGFYRSQIGGLMKTEVNWFAAFIFYVLFTFGLVVFVIAPALEKNSWQNALLFGLFFGLVTYSTYDLTNLAVTKNWPLDVTVVDLLWGSFLSAAVCVIVFFIARKFGV